MAETEGKNKKYDLEDRLIDFSVSIINIVEKLPNTRTGNHIANQLVRCGTSPAPNYGEAQSAESRQDFIHKIKICLKELRETKIWLKVIQRKNLIKNNEEVEALLGECDELISIFVVSIKTAEKNKGKGGRET
jgi:four helix bundle protein